VVFKKNWCTTGTVQAFPGHLINRQSKGSPQCYHMMMEHLWICYAPQYHAT
jgi:hypothetical protein